MEKQTANIAAIEAVINSLINAGNTMQSSKKMVADILPVLISEMSGKNFEKVARLLYKKCGNITFYQKYLAGFFESQHFILKHNIVKDTFIWFGNFKDIQPEKYLDYFDEVKKEKQKYLESLSMETRLSKTYENRFSKLSKSEKEYLIKLLKS